MFEAPSVPSSRRSRSLPTAVTRLFVALSCGVLACWAPALAAQSGAYATVTGTITSASTRQPVSGALVTLTPLGGGEAREVTTGASGTFSYSLVAPGSYELRAEAIGYRPVVARTLVVDAGDRGAVPIALTAAPPPVLTVDTVALGGAANGRWRAGGVRFGAQDLFGWLPHRFDDLGSIVALSSGADESLGLVGLPGTMTGLVADGVPLYRAAHPLARADLVADPMFPRSMLSGVTVQRSPADVALPGFGSGYVAMSTLAGTGAALEAAWSGDPLWSSDELDVDVPALTSIQGNATWSGAVSPSSRLVVSGDAIRQDTPLAPRIGEPVSAGLAGLDPALIAELAAPSVETFSRYGGAARFDSRRSGDAQLFVRGGAALTRREVEGPGALGLAGASALPEESVDFSFAGGWTAQASDAWIYEIRLGVSGSDRDFEAADPARPFALLATPGSSFGDAPYGAAASSRFDVVALPATRWSMDRATVRLGLAARLSRHAITQGHAVQTLFSDAPSLVAGQGFVQLFDAPEASFSTREIGAYAAYDVELRPGVSASLGIRIDQEMIPSSEVSLSTPWGQASGLRNDQYPSSFLQVGGSASLTWDPSLDRTTMVTVSASLQHGDVDPAALAQAFSQDGGGAATSTWIAGSGIGWPAGPLPAGTPRTTLTLLGPDTRPPRTASGSLGIQRRLPGGWSLHVSGDVRRTDFLMRRRDLNRPVVPQAEDPYGRQVFGTLAQDGALVTATAADARRFAGFNEVWALDPDGWSEYWGVTAALEYTRGATTMYASYTRSETTDNWIGGAEGLVDLRLPPGLADDEDWAEAASDYDVPDRVVAAATTSVSLVTLSAVYRFRSGRPFTPRYRAGVDANGDGSFRNDVAFVDDALVGAVPDLESCISSQLGAFAARNSCRGPTVHSLDARLRVRLGRLMGREASLVLDGLSLIESEDGAIDDALLLVDPSGTISSSGGVVTIPLVANPDFGSVMYPSSRGRMLRVGLRIG